VIDEPALIRTKEGLFIIILVTKKETQKSYISILESEKLEILAEL